MNVKPWKLFQLQKSKVAKDLSTTLFYPAVLGYFVYAIFHTLTISGNINKLFEAFSKNSILSSVNALLILGTLIFYCCDFLGANYVKTYSWWNLVCDISLMVLLILTFNSLGVNTDINLNKMDLDLFCFVFSLFMLVYLIRYGARRYFDRLDEQQKKDYGRRAIFEGVMFGVFLILGLCKFYSKHQQIFYLLFPIGGMSFSIIYYIKIIKKMTKD